MSNWHYLTCHSHTPPIESDDEITQHTRHVPAILPVIDQARRAVPTLTAQHGHDDLRTRLRHYITAHSPACLLPHQADGLAAFLTHHAQCNLHLQDENGTDTPLPNPNET